MTEYVFTRLEVARIPFTRLVTSSRAVFKPIDINKQDLRKLRLRDPGLTGRRGVAGSVAFYLMITEGRLNGLSGISAKDYNDNSNTLFWTEGFYVRRGELKKAMTAFNQHMATIGTINFIKRTILRKKVQPTPVF